MAHQPSILIVDDHETFAQSLAAQIGQQGLAQAYVAVSVPAALAFLGRTTPDLVLVDITLQERLEGLAFIRQLRQQWPAVKAVCLTMHQSSLFCEQAYDAGAWGYLCKTAPLAETFSGIRSALAAENPLPAPMLQNNQKYHFTPREKEILAHLATGASNKELAKTLDMAEETAKVHMKTLLRKLGAQNRTQVAIFAYENGFWPHGVGLSS